MLDEDTRVGDIFRVGDALVEVSQPRIPCYKLAIKMNLDGFQNQFLKSGRVGFYFRVLEEGEVGAGDAIELIQRDPRRMTIREVNDLLFFNKEDLTATQRALSIPALSHGWKGSFEERLTGSQPSADARLGFRTFVVQRKVPESKTITSFYLVPGDDAPLLSFSPGQFLTFKLTISDQPEPLIRTYSLSDSPDHDYYRVSIKREPPPRDRPDLPPGVSSNYFHDQIEVGSKITVGAPRGKFHLDPGSERAVVLLSGGVGLTPMISMANAIVQSDSKRPLWFIHGVRNGREHAMAQHMRRLAEGNHNVRVHFRYSDPAPDDTLGRDYHSPNRVDIELLKELLPFDDYEFYLCGPTAFMKSLYCGLLSLGISESRIHYEFFGPAAALKEDAEPKGGAPVRTAEAELSGEVSVTFARSGVAARWDPACESILDLAERHGLSPPYSCRSGICNTCMCALSDGEVAYFEEPLEPPEPGNVLICCSRPTRNLVIEI